MSESHPSASTGDGAPDDVNGTTASDKVRTPGLPKPAFFNVIANDSQFSTKKARTVVRRRDVIQQQHCMTDRGVRTADASDTDENSPPEHWQSARPVYRPPPVPPARSTYQAHAKQKGANVVANNKSASETFLELLTPYKYDRARRESYFHQLFELGEKIGEGSFGEVFRVTCKEDGKQYAVKRSLNRFRSYNDRMCKLAEVQKHTALPKHVNLVNLIRAWEERGRLFIQTELCQCSLADYAEKHHDIDEADVWGYLVDLLHAVAHLHDHNLLHMDIKPENIFLSHDGICKLGDLGLVYDMQRLTKPGDAPEEGDSKYLAPEVLAGNYGPHNDIFSLGVTILELATDLDVPKEGLLWHRLRDSRLPDELIERLSPQLRYVIERMMSPVAGSRPSAHQLLRMVQLREHVAARKFFIMWRTVINNSRNVLSLCVMVVVAGFWSLWMFALRAISRLDWWTSTNRQTSPTGGGRSCGRRRAAHEASFERTPVTGASVPVCFDDEYEPDDETDGGLHLAPAHRRLFPEHNENQPPPVDCSRRKLCFLQDDQAELERERAGGASFFVSPSSPRVSRTQPKRVSPFGQPRALTTGRGRLSTIRSQCDEQHYCPKSLGGQDSCTDTDEADAEVARAVGEHNRRTNNVVELGRRQPAYGACARQSPRARPPPSPALSAAARRQQQQTTTAEQTCTTDSGCDSAPSSPQPVTPVMLSVSADVSGGGDACSPGNARTPTPLLLRSCSNCSTNGRKRRMPADDGDAHTYNQRLSPSVQRISPFASANRSEKRRSSVSGSEPSPLICACGEGVGTDDVFHSPRAPLNLRSRTVDRSPTSVRSSRSPAAPARVPSVRRRRSKKEGSPLVLRRPATERRYGSSAGRRRRLTHGRLTDGGGGGHTDDGHESDDERDGAESPDPKAAKMEHHQFLPWHRRSSDQHHRPPLCR